jgi:hypothetical protein
MLMQGISELLRAINYYIADLSFKAAQKIVIDYADGSNDLNRG